MSEHNALVELAKQLSSNKVRLVEGDEFPIHLSKNAILNFRKARRIIIELAKIKFDKDGRIENDFEVDDVLLRCCAIAEEREAEDD